MISKEDIKQLEVIFPFWFELNQNDRAKIILSSRVLSLKKEAIFFNGDLKAIIIFWIVRARDHDVCVKIISINAKVANRSW